MNPQAAERMERTSLQTGAGGRFFRGRSRTPRARFRERHGQIVTFQASSQASRLAPEILAALPEWIDPAEAAEWPQWQLERAAYKRCTLCGEHKLRMGLSPNAVDVRRPAIRAARSAGGLSGSNVWALPSRQARAT
jgi:hypothetical protein